MIRPNEAASLTHAAELAEAARAELQELCMDPPSWQAISQAGKISPTVDAGLQLQAAARNIRAIAAAIERQAAELAELAEPTAAARIEA